MFSRKIKLTEKELNAQINRSYLEGYNQGYDAGVRDEMFSKSTPNQLREILGLEPIKENGVITKCNT